MRTTLQYMEISKPKITNAQQGFCVRRAEVQNSTAVFQLNFSNKPNFCALKSRPNAKPRNVTSNFKTNEIFQTSRNSLR